MSMTIIANGRAGTGADDSTVDPATDSLADSTPQIETFDPRSGISLGLVPDMDATEVSAAVASARVAFA
jgi:acyl-CoA reductase-like NAD-dependent aldehyde dehydrogenase